MNTDITEDTLEKLKNKELKIRKEIAETKQRCEEMSIEEMIEEHNKSLK